MRLHMRHSLISMTINHEKFSVNLCNEGGGGEEGESENNEDIFM